MDNKDILVVVLTRNYSTGLSVVRALGNAGYTVDVVASAIAEGKSELVRRSRYVNDSVETVTKKVGGGDGEELLAELLKYKEKIKEKAVLIAADDYTASVIDRNKSILEEIFHMPKTGIRNGSLTECMDKSVQGEIAKAAGINTPPQWTVSLNGSIDLPEDIIYPCFVKPAQSFLGYKQEMKKCDSKEELANHLSLLKEVFPDRNILIQKYMEIDTEIDIEGVCLDQRIVLPGVVIKDIVAKYDRGVPLAGRLLSFDDFKGLKDKVTELMQKYHYFGMFDLGINIIDGEYWFNEINMRSGGTNYAYYGSGVNLPDIFVKEALGKGHTVDDETAEYGKKYFYENMGWEDYLHGYMSKEDVERGISDADILFVNNDEDPLPAEIFNDEIGKRIRNHQRYLDAIEIVIQKTTLQEEEAVQMMKEAKERMGIIAYDFAKYEFWNLTSEEQEDKYREILEKREKKKALKESCIAASMEEMNWDRETAEKAFQSIRERIDIKLNDYSKAKLYRYDESQQQTKYQEYVEKKERRKVLREECIKKSMEAMGWDRERASNELKDARNRIKVTYKDYLEYEIYKIPVDKQEKKYGKILERKNKGRK